MDEEISRSEEFSEIEDAWTARGIGEAQVSDYQDFYHQTKGYMVSFNFNRKKERGVKTIRIGDKRIIEAVV